MTKLFDDQGNAVEAFTKEEVEKLTKENPEIQNLQTKLSEAEQSAATLKKQVEEFSGSDKGQNMAALRKKAEDAEKAANDLKGTLVTEIGDLKKRFDDVALERTFLEIAQGDPELSKKVKLEYESIVKPDDTDEVKRKKMGDAYKLAAGYSASPSVLGRVLGSSGAPSSQSGSSSTKPELVEFGKKFGITEEDFKKYGSK